MDPKKIVLCLSSILLLLIVAGCGSAGTLTPPPYPAPPSDTPFPTFTRRPTNTPLPTITPLRKPTFTPVKPAGRSPQPATATPVAVRTGTPLPTEDTPGPAPTIPEERRGRLPTPTNTSTPTITNTPLPKVAIVRISTIYYDGEKGEAEPDEYVEIINAGTAPQNLSGWLLVSLIGNQRFAFPAGFVLEGGEVCRVYTNEDHPSFCGLSFESDTAVWSNDRDTAVLFDQTGQEVDRLSY